MLLSAIAYNFKKLHQHQPKRTLNLILTLQTSVLQIFKHILDAV